MTSFFKAGNPSRRQFLRMTAAGFASLGTLRAARREPAPDGPPIGCAVVGVGLRGREILQTLSQIERARVDAYCDLYEPFLRRGERLAPEAKGYADYHELLEAHPQTEAIFVATPTHLHRAVVEDALAAGKHVFCEAPLASTIEDARAIAEAAKAASTTFAVGLQNRANPIFDHTSKFLRARATGSPVTDKGHWFENNSWRRAVADSAFEEAMNWRLDKEVSLGLLGEAGVHSFDNTLRYVSGYPQAVSAYGSVTKWRDGREIPDTVFALFKFPNGFISRFESTLANSFRERYYSFHGDVGTILMEDLRSWWFKEADAPNLGWEVYASRERIGNEEGIVLLADATKLLEQGLIPAEERHGSPELEDDPLFIVVQDFLAAVTEGEAPACTYQEGYRSVVMAVKANEALRAGSSVKIEQHLFEI